jgi:hypothetical protein
MKTFKSKPIPIRTSQVANPTIIVFSGNIWNVNVSMVLVAIPSAGLNPSKYLSTPNHKNIIPMLIRR